MNNSDNVAAVLTVGIVFGFAAWLMKEVIGLALATPVADIPRASMVVTETTRSEISCFVELDS